MCLENFYSQRKKKVKADVWNRHYKYNKIVGHWHDLPIHIYSKDLCIQDRTVQHSQCNSTTIPLYPLPHRWRAVILYLKSCHKGHSFSVSSKANHFSLRETGVMGRSGPYSAHCRRITHKRVPKALGDKTRIISHSWETENSTSLTHFQCLKNTKK